MPQTKPIKRPHRPRLVLNARVRCTGWNRPPDKRPDWINPSDTPDAARAVLAEVTEMFDRLSIRHHISDGTLLGLIREGGFIAGDNDVDIRIDRAAVNDGLVQTFEDQGFSLLYRDWVDGAEVTLAFYKGGTVVDLLPTDFGNGHSLFHIPRHRKYYLTYRLPFDGVERRDFDGVSVWIPQNPERELEACYGPRWREPVAQWEHFFSHQALIRCTGPFRHLFLCAFNFVECQRCLNGGDKDKRPWSVREFASAMRYVAGMRPQFMTNRFL